MTTEIKKINNRRDYSKLNFGKKLLGDGGTLIVVKVGCDIAKTLSPSNDTVSKLQFASILTGTLGAGFLVLGLAMTARGYGFDPVARMKAVPAKLWNAIHSDAPKHSPR